MTELSNARMLIIVPTRSRPESVAKVVRAWEETHAFRHADLCFSYDMDDPHFAAYSQALLESDAPGDATRWVHCPSWKPLVPKLNTAAMLHRDQYFAIGFAGDDHLPRTHGWAARYLEALIEMGTGIVSCPDGYRDDDLPTQWAMTADIVRALGRMVPAPVEHLYCDDAIRDLAKAADCWCWMPDLLIEHMHPLNAKRNGVAWDDQYRRVNNPEQYERDSAAYEAWKRPGAELHLHSEIVRGLRRARQAH